MDGRMQRLSWATGAPAMVAIAVSLGGCFGSQAPLIGAKDSLMLFGREGGAVRVMYDQLGGPAQERIRFAWRDDGYRIERGRGPEPAAYRLQRLENDWYIWEKFQDGETAVYGLARLEGARVWAYAPECGQLGMDVQRALGLRMGADGACWLTSQQQLQAAMRSALDSRMRLIGYFELEGR